MTTVLVGMSPALARHRSTSLECFALAQLLTAQGVTTMEVKAPAQQPALQMVTKRARAEWCP
jgi:hypothetical protein